MNTQERHGLEGAHAQEPRPGRGRGRSSCIQEGLARMRSPEHDARRGHGGVDGRPDPASKSKFKFQSVSVQRKVYTLRGVKVGGRLARLQLLHEHARSKQALARTARPPTFARDGPAPFEARRLRQRSGGRPDRAERRSRTHLLSPRRHLLGRERPKDVTVRGPLVPPRDCRGRRGCRGGRRRLGHRQLRLQPVARLLVDPCASEP